MTYQIIKVIKEVENFEEACILAGLDRSPAFDELPGELFWSTAKQVGVFAIPDADDELTSAVRDFVGLFDGRLVLDDDDELTESEAEEIAQASLALAENLLYEMDTPGQVLNLIIRE